MGGDDWVPQELRTSQTGRVPQWVLDEAVGKPVTPVPFRGPTSSAPSARRFRRRTRLRLVAAPRRSRRRERLRLAGALLLTSALLGTGLYFGDGLAPANDGPFDVTGAHAAPPRDDSPPAGHEEADRPLGTSAPAPLLPEGPSYRFLQHQDDSTEPVTWSPCRPLHYVTRPDGAPAWGAAMVAEAAAEISTATGLQIVDDGLTTEGPAEDRDAHQVDRYGDRWAPVLIAWATRQEVPDFGIDIAGMAGPASLVTMSGDEAYVSGVVYLDPIVFEQMYRDGAQAQPGRSSSTSSGTSSGSRTSTTRAR